MLCGRVNEQGREGLMLRYYRVGLVIFLLLSALGAGISAHKSDHVSVVQFALMSIMALGLLALGARSGRTSTALAEGTDTTSPRPGRMSEMERASLILVGVMGSGIFALGVKVDNDLGSGARACAAFCGVVVCTSVVLVSGRALAHGAPQRLSGTTQIAVRALAIAFWSWLTTGSVIQAYGGDPFILLIPAVLLAIFLASSLRYRK
jgi:hypothetical protein